MGFTWEIPAHLAFKRARVLATQFGREGALAESLAGSLVPPGSGAHGALPADGVR